MLRKVTLEITVLDYDRIGGSDPIGKVRLGYSRKKLEKKHWAEMVDNPRRPVIHWHVLQVRKPERFQRFARCLKITEKVSFNIASEASYVYILSGQKLIKDAKNGPFWRVFENLKLAVKQCYQTGQF